MRAPKFLAAGLLLSLALSNSAYAQAEGKVSSDDKQPLVSQALYEGVRASQLLGNHVFSRSGEHLGKVRNIVVEDNGSVKAFIAERAGIGPMPDNVFRIPWERVVRPIRPGILIADLSDPSSQQFGLFFEPRTNQNEQPDFLISEVIGDYARLKTGLGYGYVKDVVLTPDGRMLAVLVARDVREGGGTLAYPYPGGTGRWSPEMGYYGLPFVTSEQASDAGLKVDARNFKSSDPA